MASSDKKRPSKQKHQDSSRLARSRRAKRNITRTKIKIQRWERYQEEIERGLRPVSVFKYGKNKGNPNPSRWDTTGLKSHLNNLQSIVKKGRTD